MNSDSHACTKTDFLRVLDMSRAQLDSVLSRASSIKNRQTTPLLSGKSIACIFEKPSTRTRLSIAVAARRLGMGVDVIDSASLQMSRGETIHDTGKVISQYVDLIAFRTFACFQLSPEIIPFGDSLRRSFAHLVEIADASQSIGGRVN